MSRQHRRNREVVVLPDELRWGPALVESAWDLPVGPVLTPIQHYFNRQINKLVTPVQVSPEQRVVHVWDSRLWRLSLPGPLEWTDPEQPDELFQDRFVRSAYVKHMSAPSMIRNEQRFEQIVELLKKETAKIRTTSFLRHSIVRPLGPRELRRICRREIANEQLRHRRYQALINPDTHTSLLFLEKQYDAKMTWHLIEEALKSEDINEDVWYFAPSGSDYQIRLENGKEPEMLFDPSDTARAVVHEHRAAPTDNSLVFYENLLKCKLKLTRRLTELETRLLEKRTGQLVEGQPLRLLEFYYQQDRKRAQEKLRCVDAFFTDSLLDMQKVYEEVMLHINYEMRPKTIDGVKVTLVRECLKDFTERAVRESYYNMRVYCTDDKGNMSDASKHNVKIKTMIVDMFPKHFHDFESRRWFLKKILDANNIEVEKYEPYFGGAEFTRAKAAAAKKRNIKRIIDYETYKVCHNERIYTPMGNILWDDMTLERGGCGARHFFTAVMSRPDVPWFTKRISRGPVREHESYTIHFQDSEQGVAFIEGAIKVHETEPIFRCDKADEVGPELVPIFRLFFPIRRQMRAAFGEQIRELDNRMRHTFRDLADSEDVLMSTYESVFFFARIYEEWTDGEEFGVIGVEGWNPKGVRHFVNRLRHVMRAMEFDARTEDHVELLHGIGEVWVRHLPCKYNDEILIDVDKNREVISVFGGRANEVIDELRGYKENKSKIRVEVDIPICFPHFNDAALPLIHEHIAEMADALGVRLFVDMRRMAIEYEGTVAAYERLTQALAEVSNAVFKAETKRLGENFELPNKHCIGCLDERIQDNFFRFGCGHTMCRPCVWNMVSSRMDNPSLRIECSADGCGKCLTPSELKTIVLGGSRRLRELDSQKLARVAARAKDTVIAMNGDIVTCPTADCVAVRRPNAEAGKMKCGTCDSRYCGMCLDDWHPEQTCADYKRLKQPEESIAEFRRNLPKNALKCCPKCGLGVMRSDGCFHMQCPCGAHFCWVCLFMAENSNYVYEHMRRVHKTIGGEQWLIEHGEAIVIPEADQEVLGPVRDNIRQDPDVDVFIDVMDREVPAQPQIAPPAGMIPRPPGLPEPPRGLFGAARNFPENPGPAPPPADRFPGEGRQLGHVRHTLFGPIPQGPAPRRWIDELPRELLRMNEMFFADLQVQEDALNFVNLAPTAEAFNERIARCWQLAEEAAP
ncbi:unnamed protein product [Caenorhabditis sp. 36 PRJEB53466]|nr:unnamed protein product [Caenorhabditis sp. 36 PRJEB53466]